jgi:glycosyltransferase involved in cell wall biosynthesis
MHLTIVSHKPCWMRPDGQVVTDGGFPFQMRAISELFDRTTLLVPIYRTAPPAGVMPLAGHNLTVQPLTMPPAREWMRKVYHPLWLLRNGGKLWRAVHAADAVHAPVPGDLGTFALLLALLLRKPLFVRHCGRWGLDDTVFRRLLNWLLIRIAGGRNVVLATGGAKTNPSPQNPHIQWIFSTTLSNADLANIPSAEIWQPGKPLRLITVSRQVPGKNTAHTIRALQIIRETYPDATLDVVGDGSLLPALRGLAEELGLSDAVHFHGRLNHNDVLRTLQKAHLFVLPTDSEGFPKAIHEALAHGLPVITTGVSVLPYLIGDHSGVILPNIEPNTIAQTVLDLLNDTDRFQRLSRNAKQTALRYSLESWRDQIGTVLRSAWRSPLQTQSLQPKDSSSL